MTLRQQPPIERDDFLPDAQMRELIFHNAAAGSAEAAAHFGIASEPVDSVGKRGGVACRH